MTSCVNGIPLGVGCIFSPSGSNSKNKNKSPMTLIPIIFHEVIINKYISSIGNEGSGPPVVFCIGTKNTTPAVFFFIGNGGSGPPILRVYQ